jgi:5-methylcytosine-specific restriction enzyme A
MRQIPFEVGEIYDRQKDIHAVFKGQEQGGISTPSDVPLIFLFTGQTGEQYGYRDGWSDEGVFLYTGEGQVGDMLFVRGNRAIRDHAALGKDLLLFEFLGKVGKYRYLGQFFCSSWEIRVGPDKSANLRQAIVFHLVPQEETLIGHEPEISLSLEQLRQRALEASREVSAKSPKEARRVYYERSEAVRVYVLVRAAGICEACKKPAPFVRPDSSPYLEPHHTRRLSDGGPDDPRFVGAICPNCHREIHYGASGSDLNGRLQDHLLSVERC